MADDTALAPSGEAAVEDGVYACAAARRIIGKVLAGTGTMRYTRAAIGKGTLEAGQNPRDLEEPPGYVMDGSISSVTDPVAGECQVTIQVNSADNEGPSFLATGILLYARDPETDEDVPYAYMSMEDDPETIRSRDTAVGKLAIFDMITVVDEVERVTATIDPNALLTRAEAERMIAESNRRMTMQMPVTGWKPLEDLPATVPELGTGMTGTEQGGFFNAVPVEDADADTMPSVHVAQSSRAAAMACGLDDACDAVKGMVVVYASAKPTENITATLVLQRTALADGEGAAI